MAPKNGATAMDVEVTDTDVNNLVDSFDLAFDAEGSRVMTPKLLKEIRWLKNSGNLHRVPQATLVKFLSLGKDEIHKNSFENLFFASASSKKQLEKDEATAHSDPRSAAALSWLRLTSLAPCLAGEQKLQGSPPNYRVCSRHA